MNALCANCNPSLSLMNNDEFAGGSSRLSSSVSNEELGPIYLLAHSSADYYGKQRA